MKSNDISFLVGKNKLALQGRIITPDRKSDTLLLISNGFLGYIDFYFPSFAKLLGNEFNIALVEQRNRGIAKAETLRNDLQQITEQAREYADSDKVIYIGHSAGSCIANTTIEESKVKVDGIYNICPPAYFIHPNFKDITSGKPDLVKTIFHLLSTLGFAPASPYATKNQTSIPHKVAIAKNDSPLKMYDQIILESYIKKFTQYGAEIEIFEGRNHSFNFGNYKKPFNKNKPEELINSITDFAYSITN